MLLVAPCALAFAGATAQQPSFKRACRAEAAQQRRLVPMAGLIDSMLTCRYEVTLARR